MLEAPAELEWLGRFIGRMHAVGARAAFSCRRTLAVADFGWLRLTGWVAWLLWGAVHIYFLIGFRNRLVVALDWLWA